MTGTGDWYEVAGIAFAQLEEGKITECLAGEKTLCILRKGDSIFAFAAKCPHAGAPFCDGWTDGLGRIVCPLHKYRFDPVNGRNTSGEGYKLKTFSTEIRGNSIFVRY